MLVQWVCQVLWAYQELALLLHLVLTHLRKRDVIPGAILLQSNSLNFIVIVVITEGIITMHLMRRITKMKIDPRIDWTRENDLSHSCFMLQ